MRSTRGFTLLEILITTVILVFGLSAIALMFSYTVRTNLDTRYRTTAVFLVNDKLEELRFTSLRVGNYADYPMVDGVVYVRQWQITDENPKSVTLTVLNGTTRKELIRSTTLASSILQ